jgi:uncharacterized protein (DUF488 family)
MGRMDPSVPPPRHTIYSVGYTGYPIAAFEAFVAAHGLRVVDVRLKPFSRNAVYSGTRLKQRFGDRYLHVPALGNLNYKGGPIALADESVGLDVVRALAAEGPVALLCVCADAATCHRTTITRTLAREGYSIQPIP